MTKGPSETRARILAAAEDLVIREGVGRLTLDAAAHEAGVSKGGILYHFPSRAALVSAMVDRFVVTFDADLQARGAFGGAPGDFTRAYLTATLAPSDSPRDVREQRLGGALLAGVASDPELLEPLRERFDAWQEAIAADGLPVSLATLVRVCCDGLWLCDLLGLAPVAGELLDEVGERLHGLLEASR